MTTRSKWCSDTDMRYMEWLLSTAYTNLVTGQRSRFPAVSWPTELLKVVVCHSATPSAFPPRIRSAADGDSRCQLRAPTPSPNTPPSSPLKSITSFLGDVIHTEVLWLRTQIRVALVALLRALRCPVHNMMHGAGGSPSRRTNANNRA
jgi:hypothetical protein